MKLESLPRQPLGFWPTPVMALDRLSRHLGGPRIFMKRDDQSGLAFGGNKVRKLEFLVGDALDRGADVLLTAGAAQSNHSRQTAAAAAVAGLECELLLGGAPPEVLDGNLLLDHLLGARIRWTGDHRKGEDLGAVSEELRELGRHPYVVPYGGSNAVGALGFVRAAQELMAQLEPAGIELSHVVFASSSGGTHAGLLLGSRLVRAPWKLVGIRIDKEEPEGESLPATIERLVDEAAELLEVEARAGTIHLDEHVLGEGYGVVGETEIEAISLVARLEGVLLDPVYTGRAMAGLLAQIERGELGPEDRVLFWHTGGTPAIFSYGADLAGDARA